MGKAKKQKIVYKEDKAAKAKELETFLFGGISDAAKLFERNPNEDSDSDEETVAELIHKGAERIEDRLLFFEDKSRGEDAGPLFTVEDSDDDSSEQAGGSGSEPEEAGAGAEHSGDDGDDDAADGLRRQQEGAGTSGRSQQQQKQQQAAGGPRKAVWSDPDDANVVVNVAAQARLRKLRQHDKQSNMDGSEYETALRKQHQLLNPRTSWARKRNPTAGNKRAAATGSDDDEEYHDGEQLADADGVDADAQALLQSAGGLLGVAGARGLPPGSIETTRLRDVNQHEPSNAVVQSVRFHPNGQVALTAGLDKKLRLFQVDGLRNPKLQSCHFDDLPIHCAEFASGGSQVVVSGRRSHFYVYDLASSRIERVLGPAGCPQKSLESFAVQPCSSSSSSGSASSPQQCVVAFLGDQGYIPLVSLASRQWVGSLKMNGSVRSVAFAPDGNDLLTAGSDGTVYIWDLRTRRCRAQFADLGNGGANGTPSLAVSPNYKYIATGSAAGVVNVYDRAQIEEAAAGSSSSGRVSVSPLKELYNLTTSVDTLRFSPDSQMLALASRLKKDSMRVLHMPSLTVFSNWPTSRTPLHYVHCLDFSPRCGFMAVGNAKGRALLYRLHHYVEA